MSSRLRGADLLTNIKAAVIAWVVATVSALALVGLMLAVSALTTGFDALAGIWFVVLLGASLAILFLAGFVCSRLAASRFAVWILIVLLLLPGLLRGNWGSPWVFFSGGGGLSLDGFAIVMGVVGATMSAILTWLLGILPILAGANYEERRRIASR